MGSGVAGLTVAHILSTSHDVTLYEADDRLGGHAHTHDLTAPDGRTHRVDSGFIVHNRRTYPNLLRLLRELGVATQASEMSMSVRCEGCGLEYGGARGPRGLLARPRNALRGAYLRMLAEVPRFHRAARRLLDSGADDTLTLGAFLDRAGFSPVWRTVTGGSRTYVDRIAAGLHEVRTGTPVRSVLRHTDGAEVTAADGTTARYDHVVVATHPDQALHLLADATPQEKEVLGAFRYARNTTLLHTDTSLLPRAGAARASWNYLMPACRATADRVRVTYDMNRLQRLDADRAHLVTLGGQDRVDPARVLARMTYEHPVYTPESVAAQRRLPHLTTAVTAFAGAYHGWGLHEDGCRSGVQAAAALGVRW
ncbi:amine oxidase [Streptomyces longwoodensis]|uniref:Amine oxidase n=1 Tax=Streptomyces longwoodensis TaxID=68231 RepID=A0A117QLW6_9ACTN|nr:amine oxidase [Streptomyces longwoodensis]